MIFLQELSAIIAVTSGELHHRFKYLIVTIFYNNFLVNMIVAQWASIIK
jgi:hypothetical protein